MCGICGFNWEDKLLVRQMADKLEHRGPDATGYLVDKQVSLGFRRLAIIDLSKKGDQPIYNEEGDIAIIFNGEIYNFPELRKDLESKGHRFSSGTDTECIVHLYEEYGTACLKKLNGMFAFCIYDQKKRQLFIARDRLGIKPLYYLSSDDGRFIFASEIKAILEHDVEREVDTSSLNPFLKFKFVPGPNTMFKGIKKLQPGHFMIVSLYQEGTRKKAPKKKIKIEKYWDLDFKERPISEKACLDLISHRLEAAVKRRLISDVPLGVFLSGGLDSSLITAITSKFEDDVKTFSVGFEDKEHNELPFARAVSERFETNHHELMVDSYDIERLLPRIAYHLDEPIADWAAIPTYQISKLAKKKVTVALAGDGGDEVFVGYRQSILNHYGKPLGLIPKAAVQALSESNKLRRAVEISKIKDPVAKAASWLTVCTPSQRKGLLHTATPEKLDVYKLYPHLSRFSQLNQNLYFESKTWLPDDLLTKIDKTTMMTSLEARVPFLDHELVEFASTIPTSLKLSGMTTKHLLKKAALRYLPKELVYRKKHGFTLPLDSWFRTSLKDYAHEKILSKEIRPFLDSRYASKMLSAHAKGSADFGFQISTMLSFALWHERYFQR